MVKLNSRIDFQKLKKFLPLIVIIGSFLYNLYKSKFKKNKELFILKDGTFIKEDYSNYEVRRGAIGGTGNNTKYRWIKVADIKMKGKYKTKSITLDIFPKTISHGTTRQSYSVILRNNDLKPVEPLIYSKLDYGKQGGVSFSDIKVLQYGDKELDNRWEIYLRMGSSKLNSIPCEWHLENIDEDDTIVIETTKAENMLQNLPNVKKYSVTKKSGPVSDLEQKVNDLQKNHNTLQKNHNTLQNKHTALQKKYDEKVIDDKKNFNDTIYAIQRIISKIRF